jgi:Putative Flp pilus-assembly TadE/G-like
MLRSPRLLPAERGQVVVIFALLLPVFLALCAVVIGVGNWFTHAKHLQTKADAGALAGGGVWEFPCGPSLGSVDVRIRDAARRYSGPSTVAPTGAFNPQIGGVPSSSIHTILNGPAWYDDDSNPAASENLAICNTKSLDVKMTEDNSFPLGSILPFYPDIKRKARVEIDSIFGLSGLLPIAVRVPKPRSAAAIFYDETTGNIIPDGNGGIGVKYFCEVAGLSGLPAGLGAWTTNDGGSCNNTMRINGGNLPFNTGVAIATSFRPECSATVTTNCFEDSGFTKVNDLCRQGNGQIVECFFDSPGTIGASQVVASGLQFIHGFSAGGAPVGNLPPVLGDAWLQGGGCTGGYGSGYFASVSGSCAALLNASIDLGSVTVPNPPGPPLETRTPANTEVKWKIAYGTGNNDDICNFGASCDLAPSWSTALTFPPDHDRYAIALRIRLKNTTVPGVPACSNSGFNGNCEWYYTGNGRQPTEPNNAFILAHPVQRSFMGDDDRSGPIKFLRLNADANCNGLDYQDGQAASQPDTQNWCYSMEMGVKGAIAQDQDEPPIAFNLKASQSASLDCDPNITNLKDEVVNGCSPYYAKNDFARTPPCPSLANWTQISSPPAPYDAEWPPITCVLTQTGNPTQLIDGFLQRFFGTSGSPSCPGEGSTVAPEFVRGRNYWHDSNNSNDDDKYTFAETLPTLVHGNGLGTGGPDPREVQLFMTAYDSFGGSGNQMFPIVNFGTFYVTGLGIGRPGGGVDIMDPCNQGSSSPGAGNKPPPDLKTEPGGAYVWGHFINDVVPSPGANASQELCQPELEFQPCVPVLVE